MHNTLQKILVDNFVFTSFKINIPFNSDNNNRIRRINTEPKPPYSYIHLNFGTNLNSSTN